jgi:hypothetical protein
MTEAIAKAEESFKILESMEDPWAEKVRRKLAAWRKQMV